LKLLVPESAEIWCRPEQLLLVGDPAKELLRLARERVADLIIMGVHGRGSLDIAVFGSTAHKVAREAPCPVMTVRVKR
jgi:nucleotide-binding universal stress UspA family protein